MIGRTLAGVAVAVGVAAAARRAGALTTGGAISAAVAGTIAIAAGWGWGALLIAFFVSSSALSRLGAAGKAARTAAIVGKTGPRDSRQVWANGGVFALAALGALAGPCWAWGAAAAGALAAAAADTWSTEIGTWVGGVPRSILSLAPLPAGMSGGVTAWGSAGAAAGALFIALAAVAAGWPLAQWPAVAIAGIAGAFVDSLLGASLQAVRRCPACGTRTERDPHDCGAATLPAGGLPWMTNDVVNLAATVAGAAIAAVLA
ncbi:MAG: DUF92 domain-containing protein [Gemmatimonadetes bacterium]|nr:DUF92 domain-containing protein [Gemmatimonadota bacterium]